MSDGWHECEGCTTPNDCRFHGCGVSRQIFDRPAWTAEWRCERCGALREVVDDIGCPERRCGRKAKTYPRPASGSNVQRGDK